METYPTLFPSSLLAQATNTYYPSYVDDKNEFSGFLANSEIDVISSSSSLPNNNFQTSGSDGDGGGDTITDHVKPKKVVEKKVRNPRFAFQTRSHVDILDDGYRWRKYGQKSVKNNKHPRSYYRCTHQGCNVKKQVQRLSKDEGVVVTTYDGMHSHSIQKSPDNFENILSQMQIYTEC
ncbi:hypothetical protein ACHQM5_010477 [Ranunculus cassubicifolius]